MKNIEFFKGSIVVTILGLIAGGLLGGLEGMAIVAILGVLETSLSFDNAVVNASTLQNMDDKWRHRFITWGMIIAVFGMRVLFPLLIVGVVAKMGPVEVVNLALFHPADYARALVSAHHQIAAFGGAFLMMVFLKFFIDENKDVHWVSVLEAPLAKMGRLEAIQIAITVGALWVAASHAHDVSEKSEILIAGIAGLITYILADALGVLLGGEEGEGGAAVARTGFAGFMYLELLDASFSFDGVIGAFALTDRLPIIAIGLGVGAMFVRSLTLLLVAKGTLSEYRYLEHGAFWAIGALAAIMFAGIHVEIPEVVTGLLGAGLILLALGSSVRYNRANAEA